MGVVCSYEMKVQRKLDGSMRRRNVVDSAVESDACSRWYHSHLSSTETHCEIV